MTFTWEQARQILEERVLEFSGEHLKSVELVLLEDAWNGLTYGQIAQKNYLSVNYLRGDIGPKLWHKLSQVFVREITKNNFKATIESLAQNHYRSNASILDDPYLIDQLDHIPYPKGSLPIGSIFYQERGYEPFCYDFITQPGALLQLRSPPLVGKTSLIKKILYNSQSRSFQTIYLDLWGVETHILTNWHLFIQWFCLLVAKGIGISFSSSNSWEYTALFSTFNCTNYFEDYILPNLEEPLILAFDDLDQLFAQPEVGINFLKMIRSWQEKAKSWKSWQKIRLIIAYSTADINFWDINPAFFNMGAIVELEDFQRHHIDNLISIYQLQLSDQQTNNIISTIGGHPYLIRMFLYKLKTDSFILEKSINEINVDHLDYFHCLYQKALVLQKYPELIKAFKIILQYKNSLSQDPMSIHKLVQLGVVKKQGNQLSIKCDLYRYYFKNLDFFE